MGKRKIFTKREYEKLSKTHEGRQHINATYLKCSIFGIVSFIFLLIGSCYLTNLLGAMEEDVPIIILLFAISGIGLLFCIGLAINYSLAYKRENEDEARRKEIEENVKINKQHRANRKETEENKEIKNVIVNSKFMKEIMKLKEFSEMRCSF